MYFFTNLREICLPVYLQPMRSKSVIHCYTPDSTLPLYPDVTPFGRSRFLMCMTAVRWNTLYVRFVVKCVNQLSVYLHKVTRHCINDVIWWTSTSTSTSKLLHREEYKPVKWKHIQCKDSVVKCRTYWYSDNRISCLVSWNKITSCHCNCYPVCNVLTFKEIWV